ncbi:putative mitochondrial protein [Vitis vinifera]|uniref:Putative mitochondrial protein n=1 Tax=Vitis vinifera TaxID=29760 RepID=A0A438GFB6_VITVI|nr:putative mitochondrial protein [Vitis vinifera]
MKRFSEVIEDLELKDLPMVGGPFTWIGGVNNQSFSRLDHFLVNEGWDSHFGDTRQFVLPRPVPDHFPLLLDGGGLRRGPSSFRFENMWLKVEGVKDLLKYWWEEGSFSGSPSFILAERLKSLKAKLKEWNRNTFGRVEYRKNLALEQMEFWDAKEKISRLSLEELEFETLEPLDASALEIPFTEEEVFDALLGCNGDKASGPDGFSMAFWQFAWDFVKADVMCFFKEFYENGRQILDAMLIANEAIDLVLKNDESGILCKLDIEKAYDKVNWTFILIVMQKMGFGEKWIRWIKWCISIASFSVLVNGTPVGFFQSSRGLRQGSPLSPYLFVIAMEVFSAFLKRAVEGGFLSSCRVKSRSEEGVLISHLLFDDDTLVFLGRVENMDDLAWEFGCRLGSLPTTYLGMPLGAPFKSITVWDCVEECFRRSKTKGGLGVKCLSFLNKALLAKWNWGFANEREALWNKVIRGKYGEDRGGWCSREVREAHGMGLWKGIRMDWKMVSDRMVFIVGSVGDKYLGPLAEGGWNPCFLRAFNDWEVEEAERFLERLHGKRVFEDVEDMVSWTETKSGKFSVKSLYVALEAGGSSLFPSSYIWNVNVQPKISFFA